MILPIIMFFVIGFTLFKFLAAPGWFIAGVIILIWGTNGKR
jgi:hypothetical protein